MIRFTEIVLTPEKAFDDSLIKKLLLRENRIKSDQQFHYRLIKRSIDARKKQPVYRLKYQVIIDEDPVSEDFISPYKKVSGNRKTIIIGSGPAGLFAALKLIESGIKPIIIERGKDVRARRKDLAEISKNHLVNPDSNYCFGEGGAGTYSDGKLYTRSKKKGSVTEMLKRLVFFGAPEQILTDAHPHIGTNKLPALIQNIRETILNSGGKFHFEERVINLEIKNKSITSVITHSGKQFDVESLILATGHSASDIYKLLYKKGIALELKPFAMGVRIEHAQQLIDKIQYHCEIRNENLPPATFSMVNQTKRRSVYSFCMCPGGVIAPCATAPGEIVTNGWSPSKRNNPFANAGIVVNVTHQDTKAFKAYGPLAGLYFRASIEKKAWEAGGKTQSAPAQRLLDFLNDKFSDNLPDCSYLPGIKSAEIKNILPKEMVVALKQSLKKWGQTMPGFLTNQAVLVAVESRTSSPVRIPRDKEKLHHIEISNLYPAGEGAGYAGGIISAAIDGERCAAMIASE